MRALRIGLAVAIGCLGVWHALPHLTWALHLEHELEGQPAAHALDVPFVEARGEPPPGFAAVSHRGVALRAPLRASSEAACADGPPLCQLDLVGGRLVIHSEPPPETFWQMVWLRAPDRRDLSWLRSAQFNWRAIDALRVRVTTPRSKLDSWRFEACDTRGVVAQTRRGEIANYIVAAYARDGSGARVLAVSGLEKPELVRLLSTIRFEPRVRS